MLHRTLRRDKNKNPGSTNKKFWQLIIRKIIEIIMPPDVTFKG